MVIPHPCSQLCLYLCFSKEKYVNTLLSLKMTKDLSNFLFVQYCYGNTLLMFGASFPGDNTFNVLC